ARRRRRGADPGLGLRQRQRREQRATEDRERALHGGSPCAGHRALGLATSAWRASVSESASVSVGAVLPSSVMRRSSSMVLAGSVAPYLLASASACRPSAVRSRSSKARPAW